jgi:branched-chain amino acid transport system ATP-binding protein
MALLTLRGVTKHFGGIYAVKGVDLSVSEGSIVGLIGPNGAGKTTIFNLITGIYRPDQGEIALRGRDLAGLKPHEVARCGIARTFQNLQLFNDMTVLENVMTGAYLQGKKGFWRSLFSYPPRCREEKKFREESIKLLEEVGLAELAEYPASVVPFGEQRLLEIARALAAKPSLLLLDEPAAGLNQVESQVLTEYLKRLRAAGIAMVLIEHDMDTVMEAADFVVVLNFGEVIASGPPAEIQKHPEVIKAYLGEDEEIA